MKVRQLLGIVLFAAISVSHSIGQERQEPAHNVLPEFNWDRVPVSVHFGIGDGLDPEQYDFVAQHFNFISTAGRLPRDSHGSADIHRPSRSCHQEPQPESESAVLLVQR